MYLNFLISKQINIREIFQIIVGTLLVAFIIDIPSQNIRRLIVNRIFIERPHQESDETEPLSGVEPSEASEEPSEHVTSDTPEPPDTIWGSDPEEEEQKYLTRRRSSVTVTNKESSTAKEEPAEEETEEDEEENEISEAEEVKKRPETPPATPPPIEKKSSEEDTSTYRRRRRPVSDD